MSRSLPDVAGESPTPHRSSKDTKRWCLGKVGREHEPEWVPCKHDRRRGTWLDYRCTKCGKELDRCWPWHVPAVPGSRVGRNGCLRGCGSRHKAAPPLTLVRVTP